MFCNNNAEDIFIVNVDGKEIHRASHACGSCNLDRMGAKRHAICTVKTKADYDAELKSWKAKGFSTCGHCF